MAFDADRNLELILTSPTYRRAEDDLAFIKSPALRPLRLAMELMKPEMVQQARNVNSTIVVFGGTRIIERSEAERRLAEAEAKLAKDPQNRMLQHVVSVARKRIASSRYYDEARRFAQIVSQSCQRDGRCDYVIVTGGGPGVMEAANRGAADVGAISIGLNITLPEEQVPNPYITPDLCFQFHYFAIRKMHFLLRARAMVAFPGGYGTMDELFETLTLVQTKTMERIPIVLFGREYWDRVVNFQAFVDEGTINPSDLDLFAYAESAEEAWNHIGRFYSTRGSDVPKSPIHRN